MKTHNRSRGSLARGFRKCAAWRGHYPALIYMSAAREIEIAFDGDATRPPDCALRIREVRNSDDLPSSAGQLRRWIADAEARRAEAESEPIIETSPSDDTRGATGVPNESTD